MSIVTSPTHIMIHKPSGSGLCTSDDKLVYKERTLSGSSSISGTTVRSISYDRPGNKGFTLAYITVTSATGADALDLLIGLKMPLNTVLVTGLHTFEAGSSANADTMVLAAAQLGDNMVFKQYYTSGTYTSNNAATLPSISFDYDFETYSYL